MAEIKSENQKWEWTDYGVLSNEAGEAILDVDNWNVDPEHAVLIQSAPVLLQALQNIKLIVEDSEIAQKVKVLSLINSAIQTATQISKH